MSLKEIREKNIRKGFCNNIIDYSGLSDEHIKEVKQDFENFIRPLSKKRLIELNEKEK